MKNRIKGFTLIECIIAIAILAIATLTMAQIYAGVSRINRDNQINNTSISNQVEYIEKRTNTEAKAYYYGGSDTPDANLATNKQAPHNYQSLSTSNYIIIEKVKPGGTKEEYSFPVDLYVFESRDPDGNSYGSMSSQYANYFGNSESDDRNSMRYKYIAGHNNKVPENNNGADPGNGGGSGDPGNGGVTPNAPAGGGNGNGDGSAGAPADGGNNNNSGSNQSNSQNNNNNNNNNNNWGNWWGNWGN